jgi:hypothetical protein
MLNRIQENIPNRWAKQTEEQSAIWDRYNNIIAPKIIRTALEKGPCDLIDLYQVLSSARLRCEYEKKPTKDKL